MISHVPPRVIISTYIHSPLAHLWGHNTAGCLPDPTAYLTHKFCLDLMLNSLTAHWRELEHFC